MSFDSLPINWQFLVSPTQFDFEAMLMFSAERKSMLSYHVHRARTVQIFLGNSSVGAVSHSSLLWVEARERAARGEMMRRDLLTMMILLRVTSMTLIFTCQP